MLKCVRFFHPTKVVRLVVAIRRHIVPILVGGLSIRVQNDIHYVPPCETEHGSRRIILTDRLTNILSSPSMGTNIPKPSATNRKLAYLILALRMVAEHDLVTRDGTGVGFILKNALVSEDVLNGSGSRVCHVNVVEAMFPLRKE